MLSLLGYGKGSILSSDLSLFSADRQSSSCLAQLTEDEFAYLKTEVFQLEPESWLYKGTVYPEKQSIHRPVMLVVNFGSWVQEKVLWIAWELCMLGTS